MKLFLRLTLITLTIILVIGAILAAVQTGAVQNLLPTQGGRNRPEFTDEGSAPQLTQGQTESFEPRGEREGGGWRGLGTVARDLGIFAVLFVAVMGLTTVSNWITRWRRKPAQL